jgi:hypothetical protein
LPAPVLNQCFSLGGQKSFCNNISHDQTYAAQQNDVCAASVISELPARQTILNAIGNLLADGCQVEQFLFAKDIFGFFGKLPIRCRLAPKVIIPIHPYPLLMAQGDTDKIAPRVSEHHLQ